MQVENPARVGRQRGYKVVIVMTHSSSIERRMVLRALGAEVVIVAGTGGTISGTGPHLKSMNPKVKVVGVEPAESPVMQGGKPVPYVVGTDPGMILETIDVSVMDELVSVTDEETLTMTRRLGFEEGLLVGWSKKFQFPLDLFCAPQEKEKVEAVADEVRNLSLE
ncbi:hypothetical protein R1sor_003887 [Riccia sorocarpa]|uniref:Tryptophan synthase beta chain-like PALP domain-containing protein n=1 Tax=Riccia sorocarpa TaxID=122646 RepID=A0ABD3H6G0_9MARC